MAESVARVDPIVALDTQSDIMFVQNAALDVPSAIEVAQNVATQALSVVRID